MSKTKQGLTTGRTTPRQFRLKSDTLDQLDRIATEYGLSTRSDAIRFLANQEVKKIEKKSRNTD